MKQYIKKIKNEISKECPHVFVEYLEDQECCIFLNEAKGKCCFLLYDEIEASYKCQYIDVKENNYANLEGFTQDDKVKDLSDKIFKPLQISMLKEYIN